MRYVTSVFFILLILISISMTGNAEYVFKKDGSIKKGVIVKDAPSFIMIRNKGGGAERISRNNIARILYSELYMGKVYVRLTTGEVIEGYQVDEDRDSYFFRKDINKPDEFSLPRKKVMFIARTNPTDLTSEASIEKILIKWNPPFKPAKLYKVYMRENKKGEKFRVIAETDDVTYTLKKLNKSRSYEVYVAAISDGGEESLPSEKIIANTIPHSPESLCMKDVPSPDRKTVALIMSWKPVGDAASRVKSYTVYKIDDDERKKLGSVTGTEFIIKNFPAEGKHYFSVVSVNDLGTESEDVAAVYDAGYKIYTRVSGNYLMPLGDLGVIADSGYGGLVDLSIGGKTFSAGFETGYLSFSGADDEIESMAIIPMLVTADYRLPLFFLFSLRPVIKGGGVYIINEYIVHKPLAPLETEMVKTNKFNPMVSFGTYLEFGIADSFSLFGGVEYSVMFENSGEMSFISYSFGVSAVF